MPLNFGMVGDQIRVKKKDPPVCPWILVRSVTKLGWKKKTPSVVTVGLGWPVASRELLHKSKFSRKSGNKSWFLSPIFFRVFLEIFHQFSALKITLKNRILRCSSRLIIISIGLTVTLFSEKMLIYTRCICGFIPNLNKKYFSVSIFSPGHFYIFCTKPINHQNIGASF